MLDYSRDSWLGFAVSTLLCYYILSPVMTGSAWETSGILWLLCVQKDLLLMLSALFLLNFSRFFFSTEGATLPCLGKSVILLCLPGIWLSSTQDRFKSHFRSMSIGTSSVVLMSGPKFSLLRWLILLSEYLASTIAFGISILPILFLIAGSFSLFDSSVSRIRS